MPWNEAGEPAVVGEFARDHGALVPDRFACLRARQAANDPLSVPRGPVAKVSRDGILRQIEERRQRRLLRQAGQAFNPVYGEGMSVAAQEACLLRDLLQRLASNRRPIGELAPAFFDGVQSLIETPSSVATLDFVFPDTRGSVRSPRT